MKLQKTFLFGLLMTSMSATTSLAQSKAAGTDINSNLPTDINCDEADSLSTTQDEPLFSADQMPSFPGGIVALMQFIASNVKYPTDAQKKGIQGQVVVKFIVERDGSTSNHKIVRSKYPSLDEEAIRVVRSMPKWNPGIMNGKPIRVRYNIPIAFRLDKPKTEKDIYIQ